MNLVAGDPTDNPISYTINAPQATGVDVSPVVGQSFTGVVATFSDGTDTNPTGFTATINWGDGHTSSGVIAFAGSKNETNINGQIVTVSLFTVTGTNTYAASRLVPDQRHHHGPEQQHRHGQPHCPRRLCAARGDRRCGRSTPLPARNFTQPDRRHLHRSGPGGEPGRPGHQRSHDPVLGQHQLGRRYSPVGTGTITYNSGNHTFSVAGSHTYAQAGAYSIAVTVTPLTVSVERIDSSDPNIANRSATRTATA